VAADRPRERAARPDVLGGVLVTAGLVLGVFTIVTTSEPPLRIGVGVLAVALLVLFVVRQQRAVEPLVRLSIFRSRAVSGGNVVQLLTVAGMLGFQFVMALYLQQALSYSPAATGLAILPISAGIALVSLTLSGRLIARAGARRVLLVGELLLVAGLLLLARESVGLYAADVLPSVLLLGAGAGLFLPAVTTVIMSDATPEDSGLASGLANTSQQVGGALGVAVLAAVAAARTDAAAAAGSTVQEALVSGYHLAFVVSAGLVAAGIPLTLTVLRRDRL
jgi:MFS family permease